MSDSLSTQRRHMDTEWTPPAWWDRRCLTPMADYARFSSLIACRELLPRDLARRSLLLVHCGWGEDAHFFQTEGVVRLAGSDVSRRAVKLLTERCPGARGILSDTGRLPFADASFDLVGVRSGLHHLDDPFTGLSEMARVAREGVFFIEGQDTPLVPLLVWLGFLEAEEEAGNRVYRFKREEVRERLLDLGIEDHVIKTAWFMQLPFLFAVGRAVPGRFPRWALRAFVRVFNVFFGRLGNCLVVVGRKRPWD